MEKLERRQDSFEATQHVTMNCLNFMQSDLTSSHKAMHELLAIVKKIAAKRRVLFGRKIELISQLATTTNNSSGKASIARELMESLRASLLNWLS